VRSKIRDDGDHLMGDGGEVAYVLLLFLIATVK
jgi:hypothetical protein